MPPCFYRAKDKLHTQSCFKAIYWQTYSLLLTDQAQNDPRITVMSTKLAITFFENRNEGGTRVARGWSIDQGSIRDKVACVASVFVWFRSKRRPSRLKKTVERGFWPGFDRARNETRTKNWKRGEEGKERNLFLPFSPNPSPLFYLRHFSRGLWLWLLFLILCS